MTKDKMAELIARAIYERGRVYGQPRWCDLPESQRGHPCDIALAVIAAIESAALCIVPREPTEGMIRALNSYAMCAGFIEEGYRAMIAAAARELEARVGQATSYFIPDDAVSIDAGGTVRRIKPGEG